MTSFSRAVFTVVFGCSLSYSLVGHAQPSATDVDRARNYYKIARECHDNKQYGCAIENYKKSYQLIEKPQTIIGIAFACYDKFDSLTQDWEEGRLAFACADEYFKKSTDICGDSTQTFHSKPENCGELRRYYHNLYTEMGRRSYNMAHKLYKDKDYSTAAELFQKSYSLGHPADSLRMACLAFEKMNDCAHAETVCQRYQDVLDGFQRNQEAGRGLVQTTRVLAACKPSPPPAPSAPEELPRTGPEPAQVAAAASAPTPGPVAPAPATTPQAPPPVDPPSMSDYHPAVPLPRYGYRPVLPPRSIYGYRPIVPRQTGFGLPQPTYRVRHLDHARNLQVSGLVLGGIGLGGIALGVALSQTTQPELGGAPVDGIPRWTPYDYVTLGGAGVALLGGVLWLGGRLSRHPAPAIPVYGY